MWFENKQKKVEAKIDEYCGHIAQCLAGFREAFEAHCRDNDPSAREADYKKLHHAEHLADDVRRDIEVMMYSEALFPESREDILRLLETMDRVPNHAESAVRRLWYQRIRIPAELHPGLLSLVDITHRCGEVMLDGVRRLFADFVSAPEAAGRVDQLESDADAVEGALIQQIFAGNLDGFEKLLLRDLVNHVAGITDRTETVGDLIRIIAVKRRT